MEVFPKLIKKAMPAVVSIVISKSLDELEKELPVEMFPFFPFGVPEMEIPEDKIDAKGRVQVGGGSGFIIDPSGIVLTNKHVIADPTAEYTVVTSDNKKFSAAVLARDPVDDVAILKIDAHAQLSAGGLPTIPLGESTTVELGQTVLAIGNALGLFQNTVSSGIISGLSRSISAKADPKAPAQELRGLIQTDAAINPGNSGGPLLNMDGEAIGINAAIVFGAQNIGFAIPINYAKRDLADLKEFGRIKRPLLGVRYINIDDNLQEKMKLPVGYGAMIIGKGPHHAGIVPETPAATAGLQEKDIILECNGEKLTQQRTIQDFLEELGAGDIMNMKVRRGEKEFEVKILLAERK